MNSPTLRIVAVLLTALAMVPSAAHLLEMPNKLALAQADYVTVQAVYRGWALLGAVLIAALTADIALAVSLRRDRRAGGLALLGGLLIASSLAIFFVWVFPANQATGNWTSVPANWKALRAHWEYGHAVNAIVTFAALWAVTAAAIRPTTADPPQ
ncbi:MAG: hypothetical protein RLO51_00275 [Thalassobaculum sp.]|uniref:hypothetical protein n=1 Tax=Thalassobaculum sp. TaxID=2022740 RepID=UPI0032EAF62C